MHVKNILSDTRLPGVVARVLAWWAVGVLLTWLLVGCGSAEATRNACTAYDVTRSAVCAACSALPESCPLDHGQADD